MGKHVPQEEQVDKTPEEILEDKVKEAEPIFDSSCCVDAEADEIETDYLYIEITGKKRCIIGI